MGKHRCPPSPAPHKLQHQGTVTWVLDQPVPAGLRVGPGTPSSDPWPWSRSLWQTEPWTPDWACGLAWSPCDAEAAGVPHRHQPPHRPVDPRAPPEACRAGTSTAELRVKFSWFPDPGRGLRGITPPSSRPPGDIPPPTKSCAAAPPRVRGSMLPWSAAAAACVTEQAWCPCWWLPLGPARGPPAPRPSQLPYCMGVTRTRLNAFRVFGTHIPARSWLQLPFSVCPRPMSP